MGWRETRTDVTLNTCKKMRTRIFATPSEPHFNLDSHCLSPNLLEESLNILAEENDSLIDTAEDKICCFKDGRPVGNTSKVAACNFIKQKSKDKFNFCKRELIQEPLYHYQSI